ncbi:unnamed protein product, partial [Mesorhabditis spiculigera]
MQELTSIRVGPREGNNRVWSVCWNPAGTLLAACGEDRAVRIWAFDKDDPKNLRPVCTLNDSHNRTIRSVSFSHCGRFLVSSSFDTTIVVYARDQSGSWEEANKLEGHENEVKAAVFSPSDRFLATCSRDKSVWFWQLDEDDDFSVTSVLQPHTGDVKSVLWHPQEDIALSLSFDASIRFYKYDGEDFVTLQKIEQAHEGTVWAAAFDAKGERLITVGEDRVVQLWSRGAGEWRSVAKYRVDDCRWPLYTVDWNPVTGLVAVGSGDRRIRLFAVVKAEDGIESTQPISSSVHHDGDVNCVKWHPTIPSILVSASDDATISLFHVDPPAYGASSMLKFSSRFFKNHVVILL